jgi:methyl-accepting chemotaxis protein
MHKFFSKLSLTSKLAAIIIMINIVGLVAITYHGWHSEIASAHAGAEQAWTKTSQQMASIAAGGVKWNKAEAVQEAYALYHDDPQGMLIFFSAVNGSGATVDAWARDGVISIEAGKAAEAALIGKSPEEAVTDATAGGPGTLAVMIPLPAGKNGKPGGYVTTIWSTAAILAAAEVNSLVLVGSQTAVIAMVIGAFLVAMRGLVGKPLTALTTRVGQLQNGDLASPVAYGHRGDEIGVIARALEVFRKEAEDKIIREDESRRQAKAMEEERARSARQIEESASHQTQAVTMLGEALERLASGDFAVSLRRFRQAAQRLQPHGCGCLCRNLRHWQFHPVRRGRRDRNRTIGRRPVAAHRAAGRRAGTDGRSARRDHRHGTQFGAKGQ